MKAYQRIAEALVARENCERTNNKEWHKRHSDTIISIVKNTMPYGSGFDNGTTFNWDKSTPGRLVFSTSFHHMNDAGYYDRWTDHDIIVTPDFVSRFDIRVTGRNRNDIKDYIAETFQYALDNDTKE